MEIKAKIFSVFTFLKLICNVIWNKKAVLKNKDRLTNKPYIKWNYITYHKNRATVLIYQIYFWTLILLFTLMPDSVLFFYNNKEALFYFES